MQKDSRFWDWMAERYARSPVGDEVSYQRKLQVTQEYLRPDMEVLEIGCGTGSTALVHAPVVKHIRATDISPNMIDIARTKAVSAGVGNVDFQVADIDDLEVAGESLDVVMGHSILHLLRDKDAVIGQIFGMLRPGGVFVTSTACLGDTMKFFKLFEPFGRLFGMLPVLAVFTQQELVDSLIRTGFDIDHRWQPDKGKAIFIVAKKPG